MNEAITDFFFQESYETARIYTSIFPNRFSQIRKMKIAIRDVTIAGYCRPDLTSKRTL